MFSLVPRFPLAFPFGESGEHLRADRGLLKFSLLPSLPLTRLPLECSFGNPKRKAPKTNYRQKKHHKYTNGSSCFSAAPVVIFIMFPSFSRHCQNIALSSIIRLTAIKFPHDPFEICNKKNGFSAVLSCLFLYFPSRRPRFFRQRQFLSFHAPHFPNIRFYANRIFCKTFC